MLLALQNNNDDNEILSVMCNIMLFNYLILQYKYMLYNIIILKCCRRNDVEIIKMKFKV